MSKSVRILDAIGASSGMTGADIQRALWEMSNPGVPFTREQRGYWCTALYGCWGQRGLLPFYCVRRGRLWYRCRRVRHHGSPWATMAWAYGKPSRSHGKTGLVSRGH